MLIFWIEFCSYLGYKDNLGFTYDQIDYKATPTFYLMHNSNTKYGDIKYPCVQFDYKATTHKCNLLTHLKSKHQ